MDRISHLPDEVLSKILSLLQTKDVMRTMLLSKRFKSLWMFVSRLEFDDSTHFPKPLFGGALEPDYRIFRQFVDRSLMSLEGQVLQSLYLKLGRHFTDGDVAIWVRSALKRSLVELKLECTESNLRSYVYSKCRHFLPKILYTTCETLVVLKLKYVGLDVPDLVCLRSLKTLSLKSVFFSNQRSLLRLLPNCPVLEDLLIQRRPYSNPGLIFQIVVPSLKRLSLNYYGIKELEIDAPSLKYMHIVDSSPDLLVIKSLNINEMVKANIHINLSRPEKLLHSLSSAEHIRLCLSASEVVYPVGSCFHRLKHLEVCTCKSEWLDLFMHLLEDSPSLKVIKINQCHPANYVRPRWNQPSSVPRCLSSNLEIWEWIKYEGTQEEKELSTYILKTAVCLKKASFTANSNDDKKKLQMLQKLSLSRRVSSTCELVFN
ncbi:FBD-associated F-box protein At5g56380-like [Arabidopsis lyrata subsp. lyrata]|uniref:FBD-associated F-box protein At5g56380-like n=1 Tax=Arabidopsis lyrata subsp. lyrata TaxID=81972 RepID=UPI000A29BE6F|nr:FBD-associated F-box protein At5g56380-like [Arabidopsis lyrata subsp. lyrata]|eukprot:XP_020865729.1 FBD-associated F-box protein At5g56380-like [Arabidopsis lyrata subsp. lyrata]